MNDAINVIALLEGSKYLTMLKSNDGTLGEKKIRFTLGQEKDSAEAYVSLNIATKRTPNKRMRIPLDFDVIFGMDDILKLIAAFTYPEDDVTFYLYRKRTSVCEAIYMAFNIKNTSTRVINKKVLCTEREDHK